MGHQTILTSPVASPEIDGVPVRFFRSPQSGPHLPWHAIDDLYRAMGFPRTLRRQMLQHAQGFPGGEFKTVATVSGPVVIGSHPMAQGLIGAAVDAHGVGHDFERAYVAAATAAWDAMSGDLDPMSKAMHLIEAARNTINPGARP